MLFNIKTGYSGVTHRPNEEIVILVSSLSKVEAEGIPYALTDRHAYLQHAHYTMPAEGLGRIDWKLLQQGDFRKDPENPGKFERYQAEALIHRHLPASALMGICCYTDSVRDTVRAEADSHGLDLHIVNRSWWYF
jgi:hypothetical protein